MELMIDKITKTPVTHEELVKHVGLDNVTEPYPTGTAVIYNGDYGKQITAIISHGEWRAGGWFYITRVPLPRGWEAGQCKESEILSVRKLGE